MSSFSFKSSVVALMAAGLALSGCSMFGGSKKADARAIANAPAPNLGVNGYLWRASLDTLNFMPLLEVDSYGGVIVTDWYSSADAPAERFKANVYVLDTALRADALKVGIFKQSLGANGTWRDASVDADTAREIENAILTRARELYIATVDAQ